MLVNPRFEYLIDVSRCKNSAANNHRCGADVEYIVHSFSHRILCVPLRACCIEMNSFESRRWSGRILQTFCNLISRNARSRRHAILLEDGGRRSMVAARAPGHLSSPVVRISTVKSAAFRVLSSAPSCKVCSKSADSQERATHPNCELVEKGLRDGTS